MASKTNGKDTSKQDKGNLGLEALELSGALAATLPDVAGFRARHSGVISAARLLNDANEKTVGQDPEISLQRSLTVFIRASGVPDGKKLTKEEKEQYEKAHKAFCADYVKANGVQVTIGGSAVDCRVIGRRFSGFDRNGVPQHEDITTKSRRELDATAKAGYCADRASHFQRMAALEEQAAKA